MSRQDTAGSRERNGHAKIGKLRTSPKSLARLSATLCDARGAKENLSGAWHEKGGIVAFTPAGQPNELASYRFTYDWKNGFYLGTEAAHDCVLDVNLVCPMVVGETNRVDEMRAALSGRECIQADKT